MDSVLKAFGWQGLIPMPIATTQSSSFPLVSVITPSFNQVRFLEETILSVLNQDYPNLEYIIIDGGSTDGSAEVIRKYQSRIACWVSERDRGQADAINKGFRLSHGDILGWLNSDDTYAPSAIRRAADCLRQNPEAVAVHGRCNIIDENSGIVEKAGPLPTFRLQDEVCRNILCQPTVLMRRQALFDVGLLDTTLHYAMDYDLWLKLTLRGSIVGIDCVQANFRVSRGSKSIAQVDSFLPEVLQLLQRFFARPDLPNSIRSLERLAYSDFFSYEAPHPIFRPSHLMTAEQIKRMRQSLWRSICLYPLRVNSVVSLAGIIDSYLHTDTVGFIHRCGKWLRNRGVNLNQAAYSWKAPEGK